MAKWKKVSAGKYETVWKKGNKEMGVVLSDRDYWNVEVGKFPSDIDVFFRSKSKTQALKTAKRLREMM